MFIVFSTSRTWIFNGQVFKIVHRRLQIKEQFRGRVRRRYRGRGTHKATNERVHGMGEGGATQHAEGMSGHA